VRATDAPTPGDSHRATLQERLRDSGFRTEYERLYADMLEQFAPATEGPIVNPDRKRRGRLIFGDDTGRPR
jgi:predicted amino acid dehydrogenase